MHHTHHNSLATQVRDSLVLNEGVIVACVNEVLAEQPAHRAEFFRRQLKASPSFAASIKRITVDIGVVLSLAKCFESDDEFADSAGLIHDIDLTGHEGSVATFAKAMIQCDINANTRAAAGEAGEDTALYDLIPTDVLERRLRLLLAFIDQSIQRTH